jgi:hypothetical protein
MEAKECQTHLKIVSNSYNAHDALRIGLSLILLHIAAHQPRQCDDAVVDEHPNVRCIYIRLTPKLILDVASDGC